MKTARAALLAAVLLLLTVPGAASAQTTIGQLPGGAPPVSLPGPRDFWQVGTGPNGGYAVPRSGAITSWSTEATAAANQSLAFKVFRPLAPDRALVVAHDGPRGLTPAAVNAFAVSIPVQAGDVIGLSISDNASGAPVYRTSDPGQSDLFLGAAGNAGDGGTVVAGAPGSPSFRLNVAATVLFAPTITAISPVTSPLSGGTQVTIAGSEFAQVKSVDFGAADATRFTVDSERQITAIAPATTAPDVPVTVTTAAGSATAPQTFAYEGCLVPKLKGKKLKAARKVLRKSNCRPGKVKRRFGIATKSNKVVGQRPKPGTLLAPGAKVRLTVVDRPADV